MVTWAQTLAILSSLSFAVGDTFAKVLLRYATPYAAAMMQTVSHLIIFGLLSPFAWPSTGLTANGAGWYLAAGAADPGLGVIFFFVGVRKVGMARASTMSATAPLFGSAVAMIYLGERPGTWVLLGTAAIVAGVMILAWERGPHMERRTDLLFPLLGAFFFGVAHVFRRAGLETVPSSVLGMAVGQVGALVALLLAAPLLSPSERFRSSREGYLFGAVFTVGIALGLFLIFEALRAGPVTTVVPLVHTYPFFVLLLLWLFLRREERLTLRLLWATLFVVAGAAAVTSSGG